jgi:hypothetical protein
MRAPPTVARSGLAKPPRRLQVLLIELRCVLATLGMLALGRIRMPDDEKGRRVTFADGTTSTIYRETAIRRRTPGRSVVLVVRFRLRLIGTSRPWHALFRFESLFNTLLFAAHPGFQTKLWMSDPDTGFYRGVYEWNGSDEAAEYAQALRVVLTPWVEDGSFSHRIVPFSARARFLEGGWATREEGPGAWWLPVGARSP